MRHFYQHHRWVRTLSLTMLLFLSLLILYGASVITKAYVDTPKVVAQATSSDSLHLRLDDVPNDYQHILLTVEDPQFYSHPGFDLSTPGAGWTTITQGIVKQYFYDGFTPGLFRYRKLEQTLIAWVFNQQVDKETQLVIFINSAYFGHQDGNDIIGFAEASITYFDKEFSRLTRDEYLSLVVMLIAPNSFNVSQQPVKNRERVMKIDRLLAGECKPTGLADVYYEACN